MYIETSFRLPRNVLDSFRKTYHQEEIILVKYKKCCYNRHTHTHWSFEWYTYWARMGKYGGEYCEYIFLQCYFHRSKDKSSFLGTWDDLFYVPYNISKTMCEPNTTIKKKVKMCSFLLLLLVGISGHCWIRNCCDH